MAVKVEVSTLKLNEQALRGLEGFKKARPQYVMVGYVRGHNKEIRKEGDYNAFIGYIQEHGSPFRNIHARPFLMPALKSSADVAESLISQGMSRELVQPGAIAQGLGQAGTLIRDKAKSNIVNSVGMKALSPVTLKAREKIGFKGTKPLIHTGQLLNSITYVVK